jgi:hypothetical protein
VTDYIRIVNLAPQDRSILEDDEQRFARVI